MRLLHRIETAAILASLALAAQPGSTQTPARPAAPAETGAPAVVADAQAALAHARVLAHDSLRGRSNGSDGQRSALEYITTQFARMGLEAVPALGGYQQPFALSAAKVDPTATRLLIARGSSVDTISADAFHHLGGSRAAFASFGGPVRVVQVDAASLERLATRTDLAGAVAIMRPTPGVRADSVAALLDRRNAAALILLIPDSARYSALRHARGPIRYHFEDSLGSGLDRRIPVLLASPAAEPLFTIAAADQARVTLESSVSETTIRVANAVARLPGTAPNAARRTVVVTAHYDHLPPGRPVNGDSIYNGFLDNAIGVATVLGVAESLRRTPLSADVVFLLTTAEEEGSLGSAFYATHLPHPRDRIIANVNVDAAAPLAPPRGWIIEGGGEPVIARAAARVAAATGWTITPAPLQQSSDHWSFHRIGVPAAFAVPDSGWEGVTPEEEEALVGKWWRVHHPDDEWRPDFPIAGFARQIELVTRLVRELASDGR